jgi:transcription antitermination factor NusG
MKKFVITATMKNGDKWETTRGTFQGMDSVVQDILKDKEVVKFTVEEK